MMNKKIKAFVYNLLAFIFFYLICFFLVSRYTNMEGFWIPVTAAVATTILAPKFQYANYRGEEKILMKWLFIKGIKEVK